MKLLIIPIIILLTSFISPTHAQHDHSAHSAMQHTLEHEGHQGTEEIWTCSMHPHIRLPKPGKCPICNMDLILAAPNLDDDSHAPSSNKVKYSQTALELMDLQTSLVERKWIDHSVRLVGKIDFDETQVKHITAWVPGRIERMFVDYTGVEVKEDDHMVSIYSPKLISAQEELIQATRSFQSMQKSSTLLKSSSLRSIESAREKLKLLGLTEKQVQQIERKTSSSDTITVYAPMGGTVVSKNINQGMYVETGTRIYTIADLDHLWVNLEAYETDLSWIRYGQHVTFTVEALPGEEFSGLVSFIQPILDEGSRTIKVRVNVENTKRSLKPGMFVTASILSRMDDEGEIITTTFAGKYVCPMHPEIISDTKSKCSICGMDLVKSESLPFITNASNPNPIPPLVVPASATLITGKRAVVYVKNPSKPEYEGRTVTLGAKAGDYYFVKSGVHEGELVVTKGAFNIDADLQIRGSKSMMNPKETAPSDGHNHHHHGETSGNMDDSVPTSGSLKGDK